MSKPIWTHGTSWVRLGALVVALAALGACGEDDDADEARDGATATAAPKVTAAATAPPAAAQEPVGLLAIGHSGLTGADSNPDAPDYDATENSWATGVNPDVNSIYLRLLAIRPETEGHVRNAAVSGSRVNELAEQAREGLGTVPAPAVVIIESIDNDIRCDGSDNARVPKLGEDIAEALRVIVEASPNSRIMVVSPLGAASISPEIVTSLATLVPGFKVDTTGTGACDFFNPAGELAPDGIAEYRRIADSYNAEQTRVCAEVPQCYTDNGAGARYVEDPADWVNGHLNIKGLRGVAEVMWPEVERVLADQ